MTSRSSRGDGRWQYSGKPCSYCGHRPCTTKEKGRPPHWACARPPLPRSVASSQKLGEQRQHVVIELARGVLMAILRIHGAGRGDPDQREGCKPTKQRHGSADKRLKHGYAPETRDECRLPDVHEPLQHTAKGSELSRR